MQVEIFVNSLISLWLNNTYLYHSRILFLVYDWKIQKAKATPNSRIPPANVHKRWSKSYSRTKTKGATCLGGKLSKPIQIDEWKVKDAHCCWRYSPSGSISWIQWKVPTRYQSSKFKGWLIFFSLANMFERLLKMHDCKTISTQRISNRKGFTL